MKEYLIKKFEEKEKLGWEIGSVFLELQEMWGFADLDKKKKLGDRFRDVFLTQPDEVGGGGRGEEGGGGGPVVRGNLRTSPDAREHVDKYLVYKGSYQALTPNGRLNESQTNNNRHHYAAGRRQDSSLESNLELNRKDGLNFELNRNDSEILISEGLPESKNDKFLQSRLPNVFGQSRRKGTKKLSGNSVKSNLPV
jgi:hypothetical protein